MREKVDVRGAGARAEEWQKWQLHAPAVMNGVVLVACILPSISFGTRARAAPDRPPRHILSANIYFH
jgi:hypothetical protein